MDFSALRRTKRKKIVIADDSITIQKLVNLTLAGSEYEVVTVMDGHDASMKIRRLKPEVAILDCNLREINGIELAKKIKADSELDDVRVVLMKDNISDQLEVSLKSVEVDDVLEKPFDSKLLLETVARLVHEDYAVAKAIKAKSHSGEAKKAKKKSSSSDDDEPTLVKKAPSGPFSTYSEAQMDQLSPETNGAGKKSGKKDMFSKLAAIAAEVVTPSHDETHEDEVDSDELFSERRAAENSDNDGRFEENLKSEESRQAQEDEDTLTVPPSHFEQPVNSTAENTDTTTAVASAPSTQPQLSTADLERFAREEIAKWISENLPLQAEKLLKEEISRLSETKD